MGFTAFGSAHLIATPPRDSLSGGLLRYERKAYPNCNSVSSRISAVLFKFEPIFNNIGKPFQKRCNALSTNEGLQETHCSEQRSTLRYHRSFTCPIQSSRKSPLDCVF